MPGITRLDTPGLLHHIMIRWIKRRRLLPSRSNSPPWEQWWEAGAWEREVQFYIKKRKLLLALNEVCRQF